MKLKKLNPLILATAAFATTAQAATVYTANFDGAGGGSALSVADWDYAFSTSGTAGDNTVAGASGSSGANRKYTAFAGYIGYYFGAAETARQNPVFTYAEDLTAYDYTDINSITFDLRNSILNANLRVGLNIDGAWYISASSYNNTTVNVVSSFNIDPFVDTTWNTFNFTLGSSMTIGSSTTLPSTGTIQGIGLYDPASVGTERITRISNVTIDAIPEPSAAFLGGLGLLYLLRRRRP